jgi:ribosomal protein L7/L12
MYPKEFNLALSTITFLYSLLDWIRPAKAKVPTLYVTLLEKAITSVEDMASSYRDLYYDVQDRDNAIKNLKEKVAELERKLVVPGSEQFDKVAEAAHKRIKEFTQGVARLEHSHEVARQLMLGSLIMAVKSFREATGCSLMEAKSTCETIMYDDCKLKVRPTY